MDKLCSTPLWDAQLAWNTTVPDLTPCFENTILVWIPCGFLWLAGIYQLLCGVKGPTPLPWTLLRIVQLGLSLILAAVSAIHLAFTIMYHSTAKDVLTADVIQLVTYILVTVLTTYHKTKGVRSSAILFLYWLLQTLSTLARYYSEMLLVFVLPDFEVQLPFVLQMVAFPMILSELILSCFRDMPAYDPRLDKDQKMCPELEAPFLSRLLYSWFDGMAYLGWKRALTRSDLWYLNPDDRTKAVGDMFAKYWNRGESKKDKRPNHIIPVIAKSIGGYFIIGALLKLASDAMQFINPQLLKLIIAFTSSDDPLWKGLFLAFLMFFSAFMQSIILGQFFQRMFVVGMRVRTALTSAIYAKSLVLSNSARKESTLGEIVNLMSVDAQRFVDLMTFINLLWSAPFQIILSVYFLWGMLGPSVMAGVVVMVLMMPINGVIASYSKKLQVKQMKLKDQRIKMMNEILSGIKVLKLYAWEKSFEEQILEIRAEEVKGQRRIAYLNAGSIFLWVTAPFLVALASFATFVLIDEHNILDATTAFVSISLFNILRFPMSMLPNLITTMVMVSVSVKRINRYLNSEELEPYVTSDGNKEIPVQIQNGYFSWGPGEPTVLSSASAKVKDGELIAIVGPVGAGKSSLLSALLGDMERQSGAVVINGNLAYVPQQAWIQNATLRDNILFSKPYSEKKYARIISSCALKPDLEILTGGDMTEIGEKGINLSGGQKQRVSLARAVYSDADIYLLDDPLSAVDSHVGKHLFEHVIGPEGMLKRKTRLLVTHNLACLPHVDKILVMAGGKIVEEGSYRELLEKKGAFADFLVQYLTEAGDEVADQPELVEEILETVGTNPEIKRQISGRIRLLSETDSQSENEQSSRRQSSLSAQASRELRRRKSSEKPSEKRSSKPNLKLIQAETAEIGKVKWSVYGQYFTAVGYLWTVAILGSMVGVQICSVGSNIWLSIWSNDVPVNGTQDPALRDLRLGVYGGLGSGQGIFISLASFILAYSTLEAAQNLHKGLLHNILRSPMSFFDATPLGRILNRFSKDIDTVDVIIPMTIRTWFQCLMQVLGSLFLIAYSTPWFLATIPPIGILYYLIQIFYVASSRQLKRLESITRSPVYSHFSETLTGVSTIRAYRSSERFASHSDSLVDLNQMCYYPSVIANRWLAIRLEFCGNCIVLFAALFATLGRGVLDEGTVGLAVSSAFQIIQNLNWMVRMNSELETNIVAVERILEYSITPTEAEWESRKFRPPIGWPEQGELAFQSYSTCYRPGGDLVLRDLTFVVKPEEKVGIVGRTGAGKSSLTLALFRIIEPASGTIMVDNVDITRLGLHDLRSRLTIIPQDPVLFSGTLRLNLDPFSNLTDSAMWNALEMAHLKTFVKSLQQGLDSPITEGGDNLSVGQKQLVCLARALLRKTRVLVLDEATAAVDVETDDLIQATIRTAFKHCTVVTIAHRLNTVMDYDRILVMSQGQLVEFDSPGNLLQNKSSVFYGMAQDAGLV